MSPKPTAPGPEFVERLYALLDEFDWSEFTGSVSAYWLRGHRQNVEVLRSFREQPGPPPGTPPKP